MSNSSATQAAEEPLSEEKRKRVYERTSEEELGPELVVQRERIKRNCLRCSRAFVAPGRFVRLCANCSKWASFVHNPQFEEW